MRYLLIFVILFLQISTNIFSVEQQEKSLPDRIPFKKSLTLTSIFLFNKPHESSVMVKELSDKMTRYAMLEADSKDILRPLLAARRELKQAARDSIFKTLEDLQKVTQQLQEATEETVSHNLEELQRDHLIQFNEQGQAVMDSDRYPIILEKAKLYQAQLIALRKHPLFDALEMAREDLRPLMDKFLHENYQTVQELKEKFNAPVNNVNTYLDAI